MTDHAEADEVTRLIARRDELRARIEAIRADLRQPLDADSEERAIQLQNHEVLEAIAHATTEELAGVERRLTQLGRNG